MAREKATYTLPGDVREALIGFLTSQLADEQQLEVVEKKKVAEKKEVEVEQKEENSAIDRHDFYATLKHELESQSTKSTPLSSGPAAKDIQLSTGEVSMLRADLRLIIEFHTKFASKNAITTERVTKLRNILKALEMCV